MKHHSQTALETPDKPAIIMGRGEVVSYADFHRRTNQIGHYFKSLGLEEGEHVAILMENNPTYLMFLIAAIDCGLLVTPISVFLKPEEIEYIVDNCDAKLLLASAKYTEAAAEVSAKATKVKKFLMMGGSAPGYEDFNAAISAMPDTPIDYGNAGTFMYYSSGTTGRPKGIKYNNPPHHVLEMDETLGSLQVVLQLTPDSIYLSPAPLYHSAPSAGCYGALSSGSTAVVMEKFDPEMALRLIDAHKVTTSQWVPTMFVRLLKLPEETRRAYDCSTLKCAVHAAAPCPPDVKEQMIEWWGDAIMEYWGASETGVVTFVTAPEARAHRGTVGKAVRGKVHILGEDGQDLPPGDIGVIYVEAERKFDYHGEPKKTEESFSKEGWQTVGDTGYLDSEGYLYLAGRKSHMIISGGVNIYPEEIENHLITHDKALDVCVIGVPNEDYGEEVKAIVQLVPGAAASPELEAEMIGFCREAISNVKCPRSIDFVDELPRTPTGKLRKHDIRAPYWEGVGRTI